MTDAELIEFATEFRDELLDGRPSAWMCAMVCWPLSRSADVIEYRRASHPASEQELDQT
jgi:hypothetical protein